MIKTSDFMQSRHSENFDIYIYFKTCLMFNCFPAYVNDNEDAKSTPGKAVVR